MKPVVIISWVLTIIVSFFGVPNGMAFGDALARLFGSVLGIYIVAWILALMVNLFEKKESRKEGRVATLPYSMIITSLISLFGHIFGGR